MPTLSAPLPFECPVVTVASRGIEVTLPGGATIGVHLPNLWASEHELCRQLTGQINVAMAPLKPIYDILQAVLCLKDIVESIPDAISSLDPTKVTDALAECIPTIEALIPLVPTISAPVFIVDTLDLLICILDGAIVGLQEVLEKKQQLEALGALVRGPQDPLVDIISCSDKINAQRVCAIDESLGPINPLLTLMNLFMSMIGKPPMSTLPTIGPDPAAAIDSLSAFSTTLRGIRATLGPSKLLNIPRCS